MSWETTAAEDTYAAMVGNASTLVSAYQNLAGGQEVRFRILNAHGREIERYDTGTEAVLVLGPKLLDLYSKARSIALGVEDQLDELLKALEG